MATPIPRNVARFTARAIAGATRAEHANLREPERGIVGITTDSRAVTRDSAFVALRGESHDGHAFAASAVAGGAVLVVVEEGRAPAVDADVVEVKDTLVAWGDIARAHLHAWRHAQPHGRVVAVTGSAGKTTTKELTAALLAKVAPCHFTQGNLNNRIGLPAVALGMEPHHVFAVFEMGMSIPGEIAWMAEIAAPDVAILTNVGVAHAAGVGGTREGVGNEKGALLASLSPDGVAVVCADDDVAMAQIPRTRARRVLTFGRHERATYRLVDRVGLGPRGTRVRIARPAGTVTLEIPLVGEAAAIDLAAALAAAEAAAGRALAETEVHAALASVKPPPGRGAVQECAGGLLLVDDSYNANPGSMRAALASLVELAAPERRRKVCVLGEMKELGPLAEWEHIALGDAVADAGVSLFVSCGGLMHLAALRAESRGVPVRRAESAAEAAEIARRDVRSSDVVLVKGSRSVGTEVVAAAIASGRSA